MIGICADVLGIGLLMPLLFVASNNYCNDTHVFSSDYFQHQQCDNVMIYIYTILSHNHEKHTPKESSNAYTIVLAFSWKLLNFEFKNILEYIITM